MSDLHRIMEQLAGIDRRSLDFVMEQFATSEKFRSLASATQGVYEKYWKVASDSPTAAGTLAVRGLSAPLMQKIIDKIADQGTPTKARRQRRMPYFDTYAACFDGRRTAANDGAIPSGKPGACPFPCTRRIGPSS
jgi:hypothetical protein